MSTLMYGLLFISILIFTCVIYLALDNLGKIIAREIEKLTAATHDGNLTAMSLNSLLRFALERYSDSDVAFDTVDKLLEQEPPPNKQMLRFFDENEVESTDETKVHPNRPLHQEKPDE